MLTQTKLKQLLSNWNIDTRVDIVTAYVNGGAIKADNVWYVGDNYVLKTGTNIAGLRKDLSIAKPLA